MALTPTIQTSQGGALSASGLTSTNMRVSLGGALSVYNFPSEQLNVSMAGVVTTAGLTSTHLQVSQAGAMVVAKGRSYNPKLKAWSYTLDAHDKYVLRLSEEKTLVFDLLTGQWSWFSSGDLDFWRVNIGMNWYSAGKVPENYGSNIIVGDDTFGHLWVLDPEQGYDDDAATPQVGAQRFPRVATGQVAIRERASAPVHQVYLTADFGQPVVTGDAVTLSYSDDLGNTFVSAGAIPVTSGDYKQQFAWRSLGLITQAGRLFTVSDDGAFARIDSLDCSIGGMD